MRHIVDPLQMNLFDPAEPLFSSATIKHVKSDWPGVFRVQMLHLMPAGELGEHFHPVLGRPTKELYSMAGAVFLKEAFNLTTEQMVHHYLTDASWQYALNLNPMEVSLGTRTAERYLALFSENDLATAVFHEVTTAVVAGLELDISRQRLDSTHIFSDMATFGRTRLMGVTIKRFLVQLKRHHKDSYTSLTDAFRERYASSESKMFAGFKGKRQVLRQALAEDLLMLVSRFAEDDTVVNRDTYKMMVRVLHEQCDVQEETVTVRKKTGGDVIQNPSDAEASYDGHKGPGYQAQISETCSPENEVQVITGAEVEPAHRSDQNAVEPMLDQLEEQDRHPDIMYADGGYGSDDNVVEAARRGVDLQSPVSGLPEQCPDRLSLDDFVINDQTQCVERCPNGCTPVSSVHDSEKGETRTEMKRSDCLGCPFQKECPMQTIHGRSVLKHTPKGHRLASRRAEQQTDAFRENYAIRSGGESVNSGLKRRTGLGRLRVRRLKKVRMATMLRCAGWNLFRMVAAMADRKRRSFAASCAVFTHHGTRLSRLHSRERAFGCSISRIAAQPPEFAPRIAA